MKKIIFFVFLLIVFHGGVYSQDYSGMDYAELTSAIDSVIKSEMQTKFVFGDIMDNCDTSTLRSNADVYNHYDSKIQDIINAAKGLKYENDTQKASMNGLLFSLTSHHADYRSMLDYAMEKMKKSERNKRILDMINFIAKQYLMQQFPVLREFIK